MLTTMRRGGGLCIKLMASSLWSSSRAELVLIEGGPLLVSFYFSGKFDLKNTVINIVAGLGLISFITMFCDFILLNYVSDRKIVIMATIMVEI